MPERVRNHVASTRALDGIQEDDWNGYSAQWSYHPDDGLSITIWVTDPSELPLATVPPITFDPPVTLVPPTTSTTPVTTSASATTIAPVTTDPAENAFQIILVSNPGFAQVIVTAGKQSQLEGGSFTVFAPPDSAIPAEILNDPTLAAQFVDGYVVDGALDVAGLEAQGQVETLGGQVLVIAGGTVTAEDGTAVSITTADQAATNGFVHGVSGLLFVPEVG